MTWIVVTEVVVPPGVEIWADAYPDINERLIQFHYDNGLQEMTFEETSTGFNMISSFYDEESHDNLVSQLATNEDYQARAAYNEIHNITQHNVYQGLSQNYIAP